MEISSGNCPEINFVSHRLIDCKAELIIVSEIDIGGEVTFEIKVETPSEPKVLKQKDVFESRISLKCTGVGSESKKTSFRASCKMGGLFEVVNCSDEGITTVNNPIIISLSTNCLYPLVVQFIEAMVAKMGFRNVEIPTLFPKQLIPDKKQVKPRVNKTKK